MYEHKEKSKENKSRAIANSVAQRKNSMKQGFGLVDNRPVLLMQQLSMRNAGGKGPSQMELGQVMNSENMDQAAEHPIIQRAKKTNEEINDDFMEEIKSKTIKIKGSRKATGFGKYNGVKKQGPHGPSHVANNVFAEMVKYKNGDLNKILRTKLAPSPAQVNAQIKKLQEEYWKTNPVTSGEKIIHRGKRKSFLKPYKRKFDKGDVHGVMEMKPGQTTHMMSGSYTKAEIAGKGERATNATDDLYAVSKVAKGDDFPDGIKNFDIEGATAFEAKLGKDQFRNMSKVLEEDPDYSDASEDSDNDSVMDELTS